MHYDGQRMKIEGYAGGIGLNNVGTDQLSTATACNNQKYHVISYLRYGHNRNIKVKY
jgi:hypothetical protein